MQAVSKEKNSLELIVSTYNKYKFVLSDIEAAKEMLKDNDMRDFALEELEKLNNQELELEKEYRELLDNAIKIRNKGKIEEKYLFKNISFLNQVVMKEVKKDYKENGDRIIL